MANRFVDTHTLPTPLPHIYTHIHTHFSLFLLSDPNGGKVIETLCHGRVTLVCSRCTWWELVYFDLAGVSSSQPPPIKDIGACEAQSIAFTSHIVLLWSFVLHLAQRRRHEKCRITPCLCSFMVFLGGRWIRCKSFHTAAGFCDASQNNISQET